MPNIYSIRGFNYVSWIASVEKVVNAFINRMNVGKMRPLVVGRFPIYISVMYLYSRDGVHAFNSAMQADR
jgi:hypothetical protein